ncbi:hypothetical protein [Streptomyces sp. NPDC002671]
MQPEPLHFTPQTPDTTWELARDRRLAEFVRAGLAYAEATGCAEERRWAADIREVFAEWDSKRKLAAVAGNDMFSMQISVLGWVLRCVAHSAWRSAPGWEPGFHPQAVNPHTASTASEAMA